MVNPKKCVPFFVKIVYAHQVPLPKMLPPFKAMSDMQLPYCDQSGNVVIFNDDASWIS